MSKSAVGFMSYVWFDDAHENGRLSEFCKRLSGEVRMQSGQEFHIFHDRSDIQWGQQWKQVIEESLDSISFLVPILTPGFFRSRHCRDELERFLEREKKLARNDLILPLLYVSCPALSDEAKREGDPLAALIANRQHADWRDLRFESFTSPQVGKMLAGMATRIVEALERGTSVQAAARVFRATASSVGSGTLEKSASESASPVAQERIRAAVGRTEPPVLVVDIRRGGPHTSLGEALRAARPGDRILVRPGIYQEGIVIDKAVEIVGDGDLGDIVIDAQGKETILFQANMGRVANLTLRQAGGQFYGVDIAQGRLELEGCDISSKGLGCVGIHAGADPRLRRNRIHDGAENGVLVWDNGQGTLEDNEIFGNGFAGVEIRTGGNPTLRRNHIHDGRRSGVLVWDKGQGTLEDNDIFFNASAGVVIKDGGNPLARRNRIHGGRASGIFVYAHGQGVLEDNEIFGNALSGVEIKDGGEPTLRRNRIHDGDQAGVFVYESGRGLFEDNEIFGNGSVGVAINTGGHPTLRRNRITKNAYQAVWIYQGGKGIFQDNDLRENQKGAWYIEPACAANVERTGNTES